jgi:DNA-binding Lrp family transcriptional regulator
VQQTLRRIVVVRTLHTVSGPFDLIAVVAAESTAEIDNVLDHIGGIPGVERTMSSIILTSSTADPQPSHRRQRLTEVSS